MIADPILFPSRTQAEKRRLVIDTIQEHPEYSDRRIAHMCSVGRELVRQIRANMVRTKRIEDRFARLRVGADGKTYRKVPKPRKEAEIA